MSKPRSRFSKNRSRWFPSSHSFELIFSVNRSFAPRNNSSTTKLLTSFKPSRLALHTNTPISYTKTPWDAEEDASRRGRPSKLGPGHGKTRRCNFKLKTCNARLRKPKKSESGAQPPPPHPHPLTRQRTTTLTFAALLVSRREKEAAKRGRRGGATQRSRQREEALIRQEEAELEEAMRLSSVESAKLAEQDAMLANHHLFQEDT